MTMHKTAADNGALRNIRERNQSKLVAAEYERMSQEKTTEYIEACRSGMDGERTLQMRTAIRTLLAQVSEHHSMARSTEAAAKSIVRDSLDYIRNYVGEPVPRWRLMPFYRSYDNDMIRVRISQMQRWGEDFREAIQAEDEDQFIDLLNNLRGSGGLANRVIDKFKERWQEVVGGEVCTCGNCGKIAMQDADDWHTVRDSSDDDANWCDSCTDDDACYSEAMGMYIANDNRVGLYTDTDDFDRDEPSDYITSEWASGRDYRRIYHPDSGDSCYVDDEVWEYYDDQYGEPHLPGYHHGNRIGYIPTAFANRTHKVYLGVEIELEFGSGEERNRNRCVKALRRAGFERNYMTMEYDGSLQVGFECITGYTGLDVHRERIPDLLRIAREYDANNYDERTGLHVHVSREDMTPWQMAKLAALIYNPDNRNWIEAVAQRDFGEYREDIDYETQVKYMGQRAKEIRQWDYESKTTRYNYVKDGMGYDQTRYAALSFNPSTGNKTVEFRMFQGTTDTNQVLAYIEFAFAAWHFSRQHSMQEMNSAAFAKFICRPDNRGDTTYLRKFMRQWDSDVKVEDNKYMSKGKQRVQTATV